MSPRRTLLLASLAALGCSSRPAPGADAGAPPPPASGAAIAPLPSGSAAAGKPSPPLGPRDGSVVARAGATLYVADEDHRVLRLVPLPLDPARPAREVALPGAPAQIVVAGDRVLVTVRDPGLLLVLRPDPAAGLAEVGRVALPADAWGLGLTPDGATAIVTSAWTHQVSAVDMASLARRWTLDVAREPRAVVVRADGAGAYITHLTSAALTRLDDLGAAAPRLSRVDLPASPLRAPSGRSLGASLGYAAALSDDGTRLFVARHALGAMGKESWFGAATVDVLMTAADAPLAPKHAGNLPFLRADHGKDSDEIKLPGSALAPFTQPRAVVYRKSARTVLVAGEGDDLVAELDAEALDPSLAVVHTYKTGAAYGTAIAVAEQGGAPSGIALSDDESTAWVFCRATYDLVEIALDPAKGDAPATAKPNGRVALVAHSPDESFEEGRRVFYNATDRVTSGGLACAGCHPEGRDDGYTWHEAKFNSADGTNTNFVGVPEDIPEEDRAKGYGRRTPILAGRVAAAGPYGWHAESPTIEARIEASLGLHRWGAMPPHEPGNVSARGGVLSMFLRRGLVPPPRDEHPATPEEQRGRDIFNGEAARCAHCHAPQTGYTDRIAYPLPKLPKLGDFDDEPKSDYKTPSLLFVGGHAPYFHDGSAASLEELLDRNDDRMGRTSQLGKEEKAALVAFLRTL